MKLIKRQTNITSSNFHSLLFTAYILPTKTEITKIDNNGVYEVRVAVVLAEFIVIFYRCNQGSICDWSLIVLLLVLYVE